MWDELLGEERGEVDFENWKRGRRETNTWTSFTMTFALGVRGARRSEHAIKAATVKQTVVKKPKIFWARTIVVCIFADPSSLRRNAENYREAVKLKIL